jgi:hypothetical protein
VYQNQRRNSHTKTLLSEGLLNCLSLSIWKHYLVVMESWYSVGVFYCLYLPSLDAWYRIVSRVAFLNLIVDIYPSDCISTGQLNQKLINRCLEILLILISFCNINPKCILKPPTLIEWPLFATNWAAYTIIVRRVLQFEMTAPYLVFVF